MSKWRFIDEVGAPFNWWAHQDYMRFAVLMVVLFATFMWAWQGFDSGVGEYGTSMHWSVFTIYGLAFCFVSHRLENRGITGSQNIVASISAVLFSLAVFEWYWMAGYYLLHGEKWILLNNFGHVYPNLFLTIIGVPFLWKHGKLDKTRTYMLLFAVTAGLLWYYQGFPQTCYPQIDGAVLYIENNSVHMVNVLVKALFTWGLAGLTRA